ncbi:hypothetical protein DOY81_004712 [Sarcophaga bullata]|nr:hypothetical protein DOY81_004712 [Sarcophaga bullata]
MPFGHHHDVQIRRMQNLVD